MVSGIPQLGTYIFELVIGSPPDVSSEAVRTLRILSFWAPARTLISLAALPSR